MKYRILFLTLFFVSMGCGISEKERDFEKRLKAFNEKEQELVLRERSIQLKEEEILKKEMQLDSSFKNTSDSFFSKNAQLPGKWNVNMRCIETNCPGSAVGDTKNEQWEISYKNNGIVVEAFSDNRLVRVYSGNNKGGMVQLETEQDSGDPASSTKMIVRLLEIKDNEMRGQREIIRPDNCHILYALDFKKQ